MTDCPVSITRRGVIAASAAPTLLPAMARGEAALPARVPIWPGTAPGSAGVTVSEQEVPRSPTGPATDTAFMHVTRPTLQTFRPARPNGAAILMIPGGGYVRVAVGHGSHAIARHFADQGYTVHILVYRLPADGWSAGPDAPLQDAQRALRLARAWAKEYDPDRIAVIGFSAGGHLTARLTARQDIASYAPVDAADLLPLRPRVAALMYPVIHMTGPYVHRGSRDQMFGRGAADDRAAPWSADAVIAPDTPPSFLVHAMDDRVVVPENSLAMLRALVAAKVPAEAHLFERGGHGFGLEAAGEPSTWPMLFQKWARHHGMP